MPAKKSIGHAYNIDFLNVVFAASSLFLFFTTIWMVFDDFDREWKGYQRNFVLLEEYVTSLSLQAAQAGIDQERLQQLSAERTAAEQQLAQNQAQVDELEAQLAGVEADFYRTNQEFNFLKADYDVARYAYEELRLEHPEDAEDVRPGIDSMYERWVDLGIEVEELTARRDSLRAQIGEFTGGVTDADNEIRALTAEATRLADLVADLQIDFVGDVLLNAPLLDFMAPSLTVQQTITPNVVDELNFIRFPKMDRCTSCHIANRPRGLRGVSAAVSDASESGRLRRQRVAASTCPGGLHRLPRGDGTVDRVHPRVAYSRQRGSDARVGGAVRLGGATPVGLSDAPDRYDGGFVCEVPPRDGARAGSGEPESRLRVV